MLCDCLYSKGTQTEFRDDLKCFFAVGDGGESEGSAAEPRQLHVDDDLDFGTNRDEAGRRGDRQLFAAESRGCTIVGHPRCDSDGSDCLLCGQERTEGNARQYAERDTADEVSGGAARLGEDLREDAGDRRGEWTDQEGDLFVGEKQNATTLYRQI